MANDNVKIDGNKNGWLPDHAIINFDVPLDSSGKPVVDGNYHMEFHSNMGPGKYALLLHDIQSTNKTNEKDMVKVRVYKAQVVDLDNAMFPFHEGKQPRSTLFFIHGFSNDVTGVFENCKKYHEKYKYRQVVPVIWAVHHYPKWLRLLEYWQDRVYRVDPAGKAIKGFIDIAHRWAFPRRCLVCHSMGNFVLQRLARDVAQSNTVPLQFDDIFMVAADVSDSIFDKSNNRTGKRSDGLAILKLARNRVHVLHSTRDRAMWLRGWVNWKQGLGALGYDEGVLLTDANVDKLNQVNCSSPEDYPCRDDSINCHSYQFEDWAMKMYEDSMA